MARGGGRRSGKNRVWFHARRLPVYCVPRPDRRKSLPAIKEKGTDGDCSLFLLPQDARSHLQKGGFPAGLNPYMVEIANIREHCSWIHKDREEATEKAVILARAAVSKVNLDTPLQPGKKAG